jgi:hypothetical protein
LDSQAKKKLPVSTTQAQAVALVDTRAQQYLENFAPWLKDRYEWQRYSRKWQCQNFDSTD